jgi:hypothetical protein
MEPTHPAEADRLSTRGSTSVEAYSPARRMDGQKWNDLGEETIPRTEVTEDTEGLKRGISAVRPQDNAHRYGSLPGEYPEGSQAPNL